MRLLYVEDEKPLREDIVEYLRMRSHEVDEADCGEQALERLAQDEYDLVLCDIKMPRMDGFDVLRHLRAENKAITTPFIFLSALTDRDDRVRAHHWGCDAYLTKPIDFSVLDATLTAHMMRKRATQYLYDSTQESVRSHMSAAIEDALHHPISDVSLLLQYVREVADSISPEQLDDYLQQMQQKINQHAITFDTMLQTLELKTHETAHAVGAIRPRELLETAAHRLPMVRLDIKLDASLEHALLQGHGPRLRRALEELVRVAQPLERELIILQCAQGQGVFHLIVADHAKTLDTRHGGEFFSVDERTDLASMSPVTRARLVPLLYTAEVARLHQGMLEISLWEETHLAVRMTIPQRISQ